MLVEEPVEHAALAEQPAEIGERDFLRAAARERIAVRHDLLARAGDLIAERARELRVRRAGQVAFENAGGACSSRSANGAGSRFAFARRLATCVCSAALASAACDGLVASSVRL